MIALYSSIARLGKGEFLSSRQFLSINPRDLIQEIIEYYRLELDIEIHLLMIMSCCCPTRHMLSIDNSNKIVIEKLASEYLADIFANNEFRKRVVF